ncbi:DNA repair protein RAD52 homolog [Hylaeus anthracinus]|uniref:DNA repair protein RAD52 homolog n=1 Tax=Hylaeus anthracinus TaxID=313031 RepID=UPI0023B98A0B|nr:DNA repair protein RAD52 homolog [Hylaeus anthracinus]
MNNGTSYPSCIKIPSTNLKHSVTNETTDRKFNIKEAVTFNNELISLANQIFGEGKWNHTVTNQSIDFVETFMSKYTCGCVTFVKIQLQDGTFHEDMGYYLAEETSKGLSIHMARIGSLTDAFKKVLSCFGKTIESEIQNLIKRSSNSVIQTIRKEDVCSIDDLKTDKFKPCAQSTPLLSHKDNEEKDNPENIPCPTSQNDNGKQILLQTTVVQSKKQTERQENTVLSAQTVQLNNQKEQTQKKVLSEVELSRLERKRKQMEKQAEYKRLMKERELQKAVENKQSISRFNS